MRKKHHKRINYKYVISNYFFEYAYIYLFSFGSVEIYFIFKGGVNVKNREKLHGTRLNISEIICGCAAMLKNMKYFSYIAIITILFITVTQSGCGLNYNITQLPQGYGDTCHNYKPIVYTSFHAMYDFTRAIAGDLVKVSLLLPAGSSAHHWEPSVQDIVRLTSAEAFIYHGAGMEHFVDTLKASLEDLVFIEASADVDAGLGRGDPHLWLNPLYVLRMKETIKHALINIDPLNAAVFEANFNDSARRLKELDEDFRTAVANFSRRDIVVSHGAFGHLSYAYGLNQVPIEGIMVLADPSPARMADIVTFIKENNVTTIFYDKNPSLAEIIASSTGTKTAMLDTFEGITTYDYFTVMRQNLDVLYKALR